MKIIDVTAAVIERDGKILIARRAAAKHLGGKWEFPGGKLEPGETPEACLVRELEEEFGVKTEIGKFIAENIFDYGTRTIRLLGYEVKYISGNFKLNDHDEIAWITRNEFKNYDFAPADLPIVAAIKAPTTSKAAGAAVA